MESFVSNDDTAVSSRSNSTIRLLMRFPDGATATIPIDSRLICTESDYTVDDLKKLIFEWSQEPTSGVFLTRDGFRLRTEGKRKQRTLSDGNTPLASIELKDGATLYVETKKKAIVDDSIFDSDDSDDEVATNSAETDKQRKKRGKKSHDNTVERGPISVAYDNSGDAKSLACIIVNNGVNMSIEEMGYSRLGEYQLNMFTSAARVDSLKEGKLQIIDTGDNDTTTSFEVLFESNNKKYCDKIEKTMGMELMKSIAQEILNRTSTSRRRNIDGLKKV